MQWGVKHSGTTGVFFSTRFASVFSSRLTLTLCSFSREWMRKFSIVFEHWTQLGKGFWSKFIISSNCSPILRELIMFSIPILFEWTKHCLSSFLSCRRLKRWRVSKSNLFFFRVCIWFAFCLLSKEWILHEKRNFCHIFLFIDPKKERSKNPSHLTL